MTQDPLIQIPPKESDIGNFQVKRFLPSAKKRSVGPFIFFDEMGPAFLHSNNAMDVRPHPHIGLSTLTWMIEGRLLHRDSLGSVQPISAGDINWMTAGRGIVHSERCPEEERGHTRPIHGLQIWIALPSDQQEIEPYFQHIPAHKVPKISQEGVEIALIAGQAFGQTSPVQVHSPTLYLDIRLASQRTFTLPNDQEEQALFIIKGDLEIGDQHFTTGAFVLLPNHALSVTSLESCHFVVLGGQALRTRRYLWWNFAATSKERIEQAKRDWVAGQFGRVIGEDEDAPLPLPQ